MEPDPMQPQAQPQPTPNPQPPFNPLPNNPPQTAQPNLPIGQNMKPVDPSLLPLFEHDADEQLICQINKHPVGVVFIALTTAVIFLTTAVAAFIVLKFAPDFGDKNGLIRSVATIFFAVLAFLILIGGYISVWVYRRSVLIVTSEKLVQLMQRNLIDRKISQLSIGDVQDVTVGQSGLLSRIFHYGTIVIETAGEQSNYTFEYVPHPHECAQEIVGTHERNLKLYGN